ncbi:TPA: cupin domain-containing protein [Pseudomonas aeruginosa]|nr:cupin domain-containing protein [Pseudomonas aeruginosa]HCL4166285.1 cupin domain-containing protein [Pseudomonas aeruginosa]
MQVRRVVTGHDASGRSVVVADGIAPRHKDFQDFPGHGMAQVWCSGAGEDPTLPQGSLVPGAGGVSLLMVSFPPDAVMAAPLDPQRAVGEMAEALPGLFECFEPDNPGMHRTPTIDYGILLEGELWLEMDDGQQTLVRAGDVIIQNATRHAWRNRSQQVAKAAFFMHGVSESR